MKKLLYVLFLGALSALSAFAGQLATLEYQLGVNALKKKNYLLAISHFEKCIDKNSTNYNCYWEKGWAYYRLKNWESTLAAWEKIPDKHPTLGAQKQKHFAKISSVHSVVVKMKKLARVPPIQAPTSNKEAAFLTIRAVGDVMLGTDFPSSSFLPRGARENILASTSLELQKADLTFANLEGPFCNSGKSIKCEGKEAKSCYAFRTPTRYSKYLKDAGIDFVSLANNHMYDFGEACRLETERTMDQLRIKRSGFVLDPPTTIKFKENNIGFLAFHTSSWAHHVNDIPKAVETVKELSKTHKIVIVSFHGGAEGLSALRLPQGKEMFYGDNRGEIRKFSRAVIDAGADLVLGHGPHVIRGMEVYKDRLIAYSLGNYATYGRFNLSSYQAWTMILETSLDKDGKFVGGKVIPVIQTGAGVPILHKAKYTSIDLLRALNFLDFDKPLQISASGEIFTH